MIAIFLFFPPVNHVPPILTDNIKDPWFTLTDGFITAAVALFYPTCQQLSLSHIKVQIVSALADVDQTECELLSVT